MIYQHMRFTGSAMVPVGDLLAHLGAWTGVAPAEALAMIDSGELSDAKSIAALLFAQRRGLLGV